jgi:hypothetical protein
MQNALRIQNQIEKRMLSTFQVGDIDNSDKPKYCLCDDEYEFPDSMVEEERINGILLDQIKKIKSSPIYNLFIYSFKEENVFHIMYYK